VLPIHINSIETGCICGINASDAACGKGVSRQRHTGLLNSSLGERLAVEWFWWVFEPFAFLERKPLKKGSKTMRKLISLGLLAIVLSLVASPVFAGKEPLCEPLKEDASKGLYGLCIAYHNAGNSNAGNSNAKQKILDNYNKKAGDPPVPQMPGTEDERKKVTTCPCLDVINIAGVGIEDWGFNVGCTLNDDGTDQGIFVVLSTNLTTMFTTSSDGVVHMCDIMQSHLDDDIMLAISADQYDKCLTELLMLCPDPE